MRLSSKENRSWWRTWGLGTLRELFQRRVNEGLLPAESMDAYYGARMPLANIKLGPSVHPHSPECANSVDGLEKRGLKKLNSFCWKCEMTLCHRRKVVANEDFFCSRRSKEAGRELFHIWDAVCNSWITFFFWLTASHNAGFHHMKSHSREFWAIFSFCSFSKPHPSPNLHSSFPLSGFE